MRTAQGVQVVRSLCEESKRQRKEKHKKSKPESSCEPAGTFGAADLLVMLRMPFDASLCSLAVFSDGTPILESCHDFAAVDVAPISDALT